MTIVRIVLEIVGLLTILGCLAVAGLFAVMARRGREADRYRDEMQEQL